MSCAITLVESQHVDLIIGFKSKRPILMVKSWVTQFGSVQLICKMNKFASINRAKQEDLASVQSALRE